MPRLTGAAFSFLGMIVSALSERIGTTPHNFFSLVIPSHQCGFLGGGGEVVNTKKSLLCYFMIVKMIGICWEDIIQMDMKCR